MIPQKVRIKSSLHIFQYQILNNSVYSNDLLSNFGLLCFLCHKNQENVVHFFCQCQRTQSLKSVQSVLSDLLTTSATLGTFSRPRTKRGLILIGLELNTSARESFEHC